MPYLGNELRCPTILYARYILTGSRWEQGLVTQFVRVLDQIDRRVWANNTIKRAQDCYYFETSLAPCVNDAVTAVIICRNEYAYSALLS